MRGILLSLAMFLALGVMAPQVVPAPVGGGLTVSAASASALQDQVPKDLNIDINVNKGGGNWYKSPVWIAIGAIAAVIVLLLIVMIVRGGGGTTIVKD